jgi:hypothetical protein
MTINLDAECFAPGCSPLQIDVNIRVALAKISEFENQAYRLGDWIRVGQMTRAEAADILHEAAIYNSLVFEYGADRIEKIMADAFEATA